MTYPRQLVFLFLLLNISLAASQPDVGCATESRWVLTDYNDALQAADFAYAKSINHPDSTYLKASLLRHVFYHDSFSVLGRQAKYLLAEMHRYEVETFQGAFWGKWRWIWSGDTWAGTKDAPDVCHCERIMEVRPDSIIYFENGRRVKQVPYTLRRSIFQIGLPNYFIEVPDEPCMRITIDGQWYNSLAHSRKSRQHARILVNSRGIRCICGCPEDTFEKVE